MAVAFSTSADESLHREITSDNSPVLPEEWEEYFEIGRCCEWIKTGCYKKVALQFPDCYLRKSAVTARLLSKCTATEVFILADTSYGSCCVDEVAALHYKADAVIHFGHSCLSPSDRLPVLSIFGKGAVDVHDCSEQFIDLVPDTGCPVAVVCAVEFCHAADDLCQVLRKHYKNVFLPSLVAKTDSHENDSENTTQGHQSSVDQPGDQSIFTLFGRQFSSPDGSRLSSSSVLYVGEDSMFLTNLMLTCRETEFYSYLPRQKTCKKQTFNSSRLLMKRFYMVEKVKDANVVGILIATLSVTRYMDIVRRLKSLLTHAGKKYYVFSVGKINIAKLANFPDVDVFVLVSCPESVMLDSSDYYSPIVTPFEVEMACDADREWTGDLVLDYRNLLPGGDNHRSVDWTKQVDSVDVSLITGDIRHMGPGSDSNNSGGDSQTMVVRDPMALTTLSGELFTSHSWQGLDPKLGQTEVSKAVQGRKGIAIQYEEEPS